MIPLINTVALSRIFGTDEARVKALDQVTLSIEPGEFTAIVGPSGSGKSTLLHLIGGLDKPDSGTVELNGTNIADMSGNKLSDFRRDNIGFVFQDHHLLPQYSVLENTLIPTLAFPGGNNLHDRATELLEHVGLSHRLDHRPAQLSGGERQRVAIARALIKQPGLLLCDEPTGNLDVETASSVAELISELHTRESNMLIVVTHSMELAGRFSQHVELRDGSCKDVRA